MSLYVSLQMQHTGAMPSKRIDLQNKEFGKHKSHEYVEGSYPVNTNYNTYFKTGFMWLHIHI